MASGCGNMGRSRVSRMISHRRNPHDSWVAELLWDRKPIGLGLNAFFQTSLFANLFLNISQPTHVFSDQCWPLAKATKRVRHLLRLLQILWEALSTCRSRGSGSGWTQTWMCFFGFFPRKLNTPIFGKKHHNSMFNMFIQHSTTRIYGFPLFVIQRLVICRRTAHLGDFPVRCFESISSDALPWFHVAEYEPT